MKLLTDEYLIDEDVYVANFQFILIYSDYSAVVKPIKNTGASFNRNILNALDKAKPGDILMFNNIQTLSSRGVKSLIPSLTFTVI
jgi:DNA polymerase III delta prime subunit